VTPPKPDTRALGPSPLSILIEKFDLQPVEGYKHMSSDNTATVVWPGKEWPDKFNNNKGNPIVDSTFALGDGTEVKVKDKDASSPTAMYLKSLRKGDSVLLTSKQVRNPKTEEWQPKYSIDFATMYMNKGPSSGGASSAPKKEGFNEEFAKTRKRAKWFQRQGMELAVELDGDLAVFVKTESWDGCTLKELMEAEFVSQEAIFERGGALGTSMHMDMISKGYR